MVLRGEVGIIVASLSQKAGVFSEMMYSIVVVMSLMTSVIALLSWVRSHPTPPITAGRGDFA
jgi:hypothetical protein